VSRYGLDRLGVASHSGMVRRVPESHRGAESGELSRLGQARQIGLAREDVAWAVIKGRPVVARPVIPARFGVDGPVSMI